MEEKVIHISTKTMLKVLLFIIGVYLLVLVWDLLLILFVSLIFAALIDPFANWLQARKLPRGIAVLVIYIIFFGILGLVLSILVPVITRDLPSLLSSLEGVWDNIRVSQLGSKFLNLPNLFPSLWGTSVPELSHQVPAFSGVVGTLSSVFGGIFSFVLVLVLTFYMVLQDDPVGKILRSVVPEAYGRPVLATVEEIRKKLALWIRAQLLLSLIVGFLVFVGLTLLGVPYAAVLALIAALFEFVPYLGPICAALPALFFGFLGGGPLTLSLVLILYVLVQQLENHILIPKIMQHAIGLNPVVSILSILAGAQLAGVWGALIAIPVATALSVVIRDILEGRYTLSQEKL